MEDLFTRKLNEINTKYKAQTSLVEGLQAKLSESGMHLVVKKFMEILYFL